MSALNMRRKNRITALPKKDLSWISNPRDIENEMVTFLQQTYSAPLNQNQSYFLPLTTSNFPILNTVFHENLTNISNEMLIKQTLFSLSPLRTLLKMDYMLYSIKRIGK